MFLSQEIFIDPLVETLVSNIVREMGYDATMQMIASTLAESLREEFSGQISGMFKGSQSGLTFQNYMDKRLTVENQYPIGQELIQYFNQYKTEFTTSQDKKLDLKLLGVVGTSLKMFITAVSAYSISKLAGFIINPLGIGVWVAAFGTQDFGLLESIAGGLFTGITLSTLMMSGMVSRINTKRSKEYLQWQTKKAIDLKMLETLVKSVKDSFVKDLKKRRRQVTLTFGSPFVTLTNQKLTKRYLNRAKYNFAGIIYKIRDIVSGRYYYGLTTETLTKRWNGHLRYANIYSDSNSLDYLIYDLKSKLISQGYSKGQAYGIISKRFERTPIEVCFDFLSLVQREKFYISKAQSTNPSMCFNIHPGGSGVSLVSYISLENLIIGLAKGISLTAIATDIGVPVGSLTHYVNNFWGGYYNALDLFLKPVVEELIKKGYDRKYIAAALGGEDNRAKAYKPGHYRLTSETLTKYCCERWWTDCNNWGDVQEKFIKDIFDSFVMKGFDYSMIAEAMDGFNDPQQVKYKFKKLYKNGIQTARMEYLKPLLENLLPELTDDEIIVRLNLKEWLPFGGSNYKITDEKRLLNYLVESIWLQKYMTLKKGMNYDVRVRKLYSGNQATDIVRLFLKNGFLNFSS